MAHTTETQERSTGTTGISPGWRIFQVLALLAALSWLGSYVLTYDPFSGISSVLSGGAGSIETWGSIVFDLSPIISIFIIALAVFPERLSFLTRGSDWKSVAARIVILVLPVLWMVNVFVGTPMVDKLISGPLEPSRRIPVFAGVFLHVVFQHWFQAVAAITLALVPEKFATLTESATPAGVQCAVVECE